MFEIVAEDKVTGRRIRLATADSVQERDKILKEERKERENWGRKITAVRVWN